MPFEFLPNFNSAPTQNTMYVQGYVAEPPIAPCTTGDFWARHAHDEFREFVIDKRLTAEQIAQAPVHTGPQGLRVSNWGELAETTSEWLRGHLAHMPALDQREKRRSTIKFGIEGIMAANALLEVIPKVLARKNSIAAVSVEEANQESDTHARHTQGFITKWARIGVDADRHLAEALSEYSKVSRNRKDVFYTLSFRPELFVVDEFAKRIGVDPRAKLRNWAGQPLAKMVFKQPDVLYGCPALHMIPALYQAMGAAAYENGLFGRTYQEELDLVSSAGQV